MTIAEQIIVGRRLGRDDALDFLLETPLDELMQGANAIRTALCGNHIDLCTIINARSGKCSENCKFCAQSAHHKTDIETYGFLSEDVVLADSKRLEEKGVHRYSLVTAGRGLEGEDLAQAVSIYERLNNETGLYLCASHGLLSQEAFYALRDAGVRCYHCNIETSEEYFPHVCTTHTFQEKLENIQRAKRAGMEICSGGIIGMGEGWSDRISMALTTAQYGVSSIPINVLIPIPNTPAENEPPISVEDILRTVALFRYLNPTAFVRIAAGRYKFADGGAELFLAGANATITGDMLTTTGTNIAQDKEMLTNLGFDITPQGVLA